MKISNLEWKEDALGWYASGYWIIQRKANEFAWRKGGTGNNLVFETLQLAKDAAQEDAAIWCDVWEVSTEMNCDNTEIGWYFDFCEMTPLQAGPFGPFETEDSARFAADEYLKKFKNNKNEIYMSKS